METVERASMINGKILWRPVELPFQGQIALGDMTQYEVEAFKHPRDGSLMIVSVRDKGIGMFCGHDRVTWEQVQKTLNIKFKQDAKNFTDWINAQLGWLGDTQGRYYDNLINHE